VPRSRRARYVSVVPIGCAFGFLMASVVASILYGQLDSEAMTSWGWRIPFLLAAPMSLLGIYIRSRLDETPDFAKAKDAGAVQKAPVIEVFRSHWKTLLRTLAVMGVNATGYYLVLGYMATYLEVEVGLTPFRASVIMTTSLIVYLPLLYLGAVLADRYGRKRVLLASASIFLVLSFPIFLLLGSSGFVGVMALQVILVATFSLNDSTFATFFAESFPTNVRLSGFAMPFNIGVALFGGTAPLVAAWLITRTGNSTMPAFVMMFVAALGVAALLLTRETPPAQRAPEGTVQRAPEGDGVPGP
ncbi:MAG: MFS transporter, partial [Propionibacteriaceae bacterium]